MNPFVERTIHWGILHLTLTHNFKNYINVTFVDEKLNLCDLFVEIIKKNCPIEPGLYHINSTATIQNLFWPVSIIDTVYHYYYSIYRVSIL